MKRTIFVSNPYRLSLKRGQMVFTGADGSDAGSVPVEDIGMVIVEDPGVLVTMPLLAALAGRNVAVVFCDSRRLPSSLLVSLDANSKQGEMRIAQRSAKVPVKKRLWKQVVEAKIRNQAALLDKLGLDGSVLKPYWSGVRSGDECNMEGVAARVYWRVLFGEGFSRVREGVVPNHFLNYGYTVLRAAMARALLGSGLSLDDGLFHRNCYDAMPLVDDMMEPFRPYVDEIVYDLYGSGSRELGPVEKQRLVAVGGVRVSFGDRSCSLTDGLSVASASLGSVFLGFGKDLRFPRLG
jgi:CRISPR-associated protein Cas1